MRVLELFAGYGSQALALENLGIEFTSDISEIDKYAIQAYNQLHGETHNWGDITKIDEKELPHYDLITYSFPCQDISLAGLQKGLDDDSGTRSSLLWECERIIRAVKPKYLLMENVKNLVGEKHKHNFIKWLRILEDMGYQNWWQVLNAKDYGIPQNRERVFVISILGGGQYLFPNPIKLEKRLKDVLESNVDEKYYLSDKYLDYIKGKEDKEYNFRVETSDIQGIRETPLRSGGDRACIQEPLCAASRGRNPDNPSDRTVGSPTEQRLEINKDGVSNTLTSVQKDNWVVEPKIIEEDFNLYPNSGNPQAGRVYNAEGISPAMDTCSGGNRMPKISEYRFFDQAIKTAKDNNAENGDIIDSYNQRVEKSGISPTLTTRPEGFKTAILPVQNYRIRKLTPRECWRLMGVKDEQFNKLLEFKKMILQGESECNAKYMDAEEKHRQDGLDTSVCCIIKDILSMEMLKQIKMQKEIEIGKNKNVKFAIEKLENVGHWDSVINITKCLENGEMLYTLIKELDQHKMAIIELEKEGKQNTEKFLKISLEENYPQTKLSIILTLIALITRLKIYTYIKAKANIRSSIVIIEDSSNTINLKVLFSEMEYISQKISSSQLYKLAGNSIVVDVLMGIFKNMFLENNSKGQLTLL